MNAWLPGTIVTPIVEEYLIRSYDDPRIALEQFIERQLGPTLGTPGDVALAALYLTSDDSRYVMRSGLMVDGGITGAKTA